MSDSIRFLLGNELQELADFDSQMTVLEWLRTRAHRTGTKEGCAEGDCGACTVAVGELCSGKVRYRAFNSCIQLLPALDGKQLLTVEDLAAAGTDDSGLHPVQLAMVGQHGSQCGFCTPGFVMSLFTLYHAQSTQGQDSAVEGSAVGGAAAERQRIDQAIAGNLCRCTGYAPIVRAAVQALDSAPADGFSRDQEEIGSALKQLQREHGLSLAHHGRQYFAPRSLAELWSLLEQYPDARMVAGATDLGLLITKQLQQFDILVSVSEVLELKQLKRDEAANQWIIGAAVTYTDALETLATGYPGMRNLLLRLGAEQVRNAGTIGGNIANGSPIGDMPPVLIALGARLVLSSSAGRRELPLEDFFIEYGKQDLRAGECVESVKLPLPKRDQVFTAYKLSKRFDQDISAVCGAFSITLENQQVVDARICFGGMAGTPRRAKAAEQALLNRPWSTESIAKARMALASDYTPLTDWRASSDYRMLAAQNLLQRFFLESTTDEPAQLAGEMRP